MAPNLVGASQSMNYSLVNDDPTSEKLPDLDVRIHVESYRNPRVLSFTSYLRHIAVTLQLSFRSLESCPKELYINFFLKFFESYSYFAISQILVLYLHIEFAVDDVEAGAAYGAWGLAITLWGLSTAWINDNLGVRRSLLIGFAISAVSYFVLATAKNKTVVYFTLFCILPLGNSMGIPMLTVGIRRYTNKDNRGFAFGLFYSVMNIAAFVSGFVVDFFNIVIAPKEGINILGTHWSGNRLVILTGVLTSTCSWLVTYNYLREIRVVDSTPFAYPSSPPSSSNQYDSTCNPISCPDEDQDVEFVDPSSTANSDGTYTVKNRPSIPQFTIEDNEIEEEEGGDGEETRLSTPRDVLSLAVNALLHSQNDPAQESNSGPSSKPLYNYMETGPHFMEFEETPRSSRQGSDALAPKALEKSIPPYFHPSPIITRVKKIRRNSGGITAVNVNGFNQNSVDNKSLNKLYHGTSGSGDAVDDMDESKYSHADETDCTDIQAVPLSAIGRSMSSSSSSGRNSRRERVDSECDLVSKNTENSLFWLDVPFNNSEAVLDGDDKNSIRLEISSPFHLSDIDDNSASSRPITALVQEFQLRPETPWQIVRELFSSPTMWRFSALTLLLINLKTIFRHLDATLPTYLVRIFGDKVPKGIIYSINPFMIIFLTPLVSALTSSYAHFDMIKYGGYLTAISPFFLAFSTSMWAVVCMIIVLSFGESIWSPRCYDYTMSIAPEGRESSFAAMAAAPIFAAKVPVGLMSGYLVARYLPEKGHKDGQTLWLIIALLTMTSPLGITIFERYIREPDPPVLQHDPLLPDPLRELEMSPVKC